MVFITLLAGFFFTLGTFIFSDDEDAHQYRSMEKEWPTVFDYRVEP